MRNQRKQYQVKGNKESNDYYDQSYNMHQQSFSGHYDKSSNSGGDSSRYSANGGKTSFDDNKFSKSAQAFRNNGFKQLRNQQQIASHRSNDHPLQQQYGSGRRGSLGIDSCDYNSNSSGYFDEHHNYENQQQAVYEFQQNTSQKRDQWPNRGKANYQAHHKSHTFEHAEQYSGNDGNTREQILYHKA